MGRDARMKREPCPTCPWRVDKHADTIPGFSLEMAENLVTTCSGELGAPMFACHQSKPDKEIVCLGWLVNYGWDSLTVRLNLAAEKLTPEDLERGEDWPELHDTFEEVIEKLREDMDATT